MYLRVHTFIDPFSMPACPESLWVNLKELVSTFSYCETTVCTVMVSPPAAELPSDVFGFLEESGVRSQSCLRLDPLVEASKDPRVLWRRFSLAPHSLLHVHNEICPDQRQIRV